MNTLYKQQYCGSIGWNSTLWNYLNENQFTALNRVGKFEAFPSFSQHIASIFALEIESWSNSSGNSWWRIENSSRFSKKLYDAEFHFMSACTCFCWRFRFHETQMTSEKFILSSIEMLSMKERQSFHDSWQWRRGEGAAGRKKEESKRIHDD